MKNTQKGFTLIELLVVLAIISILATIVGSSYLTSLKRGRDAKRKTDLNNLQKALETYYEDAKQYPTAGTGNGQLDLAGNVSLCYPDCTTGTKYMVKVPKDPTGAQYWYCPGNNNQQYRLSTNLENNTDPARFITSCPVGVAGADYGVSSSNISP